MNALEKILYDQFVSRAEAFHKGMISVIGQLNDEEINWRPNPESNSVANLVVHLAGTIQQRIEAGVLGMPDQRDRDGEFSVELYLTKFEVLEWVEKYLSLYINVLKDLSPEDFPRPQVVHGKQVTLLDVLLQITNHNAEHGGQIVYIAKLRLGDKFVSYRNAAPITPLR